VTSSSSLDWQEELSLEEKAGLAELERMLAAEPEPEIREHHLEDRQSRLLRWLRSSRFNAAAAFQRLQAHTRWWKAYGMDDFSERDEFDEHGPMFVCGEDYWGRPTIICRPCVHFAKDNEESLLTARRCVYTMQRCIERLSPRIADSKMIVIYDCRDLCRRNLDLVFARAVIQVFDHHFPERLERVLIINNHWTMSFFWSAISLMLAPEVKAKIAVGGFAFRPELLKFVREDHPYLSYATKVLERPSSKIALPLRTPFMPAAAAGFSGNVAKKQDSSSECAAAEEQENGGCCAWLRRSSGEPGCAAGVWMILGAK